MKEIFLFELRYRCKRPATWIYFALGITISIIFTTFLQRSSTAEFINSPSKISSMMGGLSLISIFLYAAIMGVPIFRDHDHKTAQTYFTFPIPQKTYVLGRFLGSYTITTMVNIGIVLGILIGYSISAFLDRPDYGEFGPFSFSSYVLPFFFILQINALLVGSLFFCLMAFFKKMPIIYLGGLILFLLNTLSDNLMGDLDNQWMSIYLDPFGGNAFRFVTKYWSINELNINELPIYGKFLFNRILWLIIAFGFFFITLFKFDYKRFLVNNSKEKKTDSKEYTLTLAQQITQVFTKRTNRDNLLSLSKIEFLSILKNPVFRILLLIGTIFAVLIIVLASKTYGTPNLPLTRYITVFASSGILLLSIIILVIYSGEAVHNTRKNKTFAFYDALPISNTNLYFSKVISLIGVAVVLTLANVIIGILYQIFMGYFKFELDIALMYSFFFILPSLITNILLAFFVHVLVNNKFLGHFIVLVLYIGLPLLVTLGLKTTNPLLVYGGTTPFFLSDLNDFGHYLKGIFWMNLYWVLLTAILVMIGKIFWNRGFISSTKERWSIAKQRFTRKILVSLIVAITIYRCLIR